MTLYLKWYQKYGRSNLNMYIFTFNRLVIFLVALEVQGHTVPHVKALSYGKYESRGISSGSTSCICQDVLKSKNLQGLQGIC